jgi:3-isopropylmalate/(R)-2-methylmalate dehydratase small subunit
MTDPRQIDRIEGRGIALRGINIDTDRIIPARFLKAITFDGLGDHVFEDDRASMPDHPFSNPAYRQATILLANENFGSGSSREHAPQALKRWGIDACVAESFSEIFQGNSLAIGLPCATAAQSDIEAVMAAIEEAPDTELAVSVSGLTLQVADRRITLHIPAGVRNALLSGYWDATGLLLDRFEEVEAVAARLPYVQRFEGS